MKQVCDSKARKGDRAYTSEWKQHTQFLSGFSLWTKSIPQSASTQENDLVLGGGHQRNPVSLRSKT